MRTIFTGFWAATFCAVAAYIVAALNEGGMEYAIQRPGATLGGFAVLVALLAVYGYAAASRAAR